MIAAHLRTLNFNETADKLLANMNEAIDFLKRNNYTNADMTSHQWFKSKWRNICYGPQTNKDLIKTKGVKISPFGVVTISYFDQIGDRVRPNINCNVNGFELCE